VSGPASGVSSKQRINGNATRGAVERYMRRGLAPIPIPAKSKNPNRRDWQHERWTPEDVPSQWNNGQNVGVLTGKPSGWFVGVDLDVGLAVRLAGRFLEPTLTSGRETRPDSHWWYYCDGIETQTFRDLDDIKRLIELRSTGCQTVVAPSTHPDGDRYKWSGSGLEAAKVNRADLLHQTRMLATAVLVGLYLPPMRNSVTDEGGGRHDYGLAVAGFLLHNGITEADTLAILQGAWDATEWSSESKRREAHRDLVGITSDTAQKIASGEPFRGGRTLDEMVTKLPRTIGKYWGWRRTSTGESTNASGEPGLGSNPETKGKPSAPTHDELRDRFVNSYSDYAHGLGEWQRYSSGYWTRTPEAKVKGHVSGVVEAAKPEGVKPTASIVNSVAELARYRVFVDDDLWNADADALVCANGTLHIPTGQLREHDRAHYATNAVPYNFDPDAKAPAWGLALASTVPECTDFLQEFAGYALTTDTRHEIALWLYGPPGSGRSTLLTGLEAMLGPRSGILGLAELERSQFALANVAGKTLMTATEQPSSFLASTNILNALISGEKIQVERKFRDAYELTPRVKLAWAMNELPRVGDANSGIFRRVKVVSFPKLAPEDRDPELKERIKGEGAGILNWALEGLHRLNKRGRFDIPEKVQSATARFQENNDVPALFVAECCVTAPHDPQVTTSASDLYREYKDWCQESGHRPQGMMRVSDDWERLGFEKYKSKGRVRYRFVRIKLPGERAEEGS
jgi:P4 family phage/plasmid primase-like protien